MNETEQAAAVIDGLQVNSWVPEVIADNSGKWAGNGLRFRTKAEAEQWAKELSWRWTAVREYRAAPSEDPPNQ